MYTKGKFVSQVYLSLHTNGRVASRVITFPHTLSKIEYLLTQNKIEKFT